MGYVYVIGNGRGFFKIGQTGGAVEDRLSSLQTGTPDELTVIHVQSEVNPARVERELHLAFAGKRVRGEWFALDTEDLLTITKGKPETIDWTRLTDLEPDLDTWLSIARGSWKEIPGLDDDDYCAMAAWYGFLEEDKYRVRLPISGKRAYGLKPVISELVGWDAKHRGAHPDLATSLAYDIAYETVFNALPACRGGCGCN